MGTSLFWGILLMVIGGSLILKSAFNWDFSVFRVVVAFVFIYVGIRLFIGKEFRLFDGGDKETQIVFSEKHITRVEDGKVYSIVFGSAEFDLRNIALPDSEVVNIQINTVFGGTEILLRPDVAVKIRSNSAFAGTEMPNGNSSAFGSLKYESDSAKVKHARLVIRTNTVFGGTEIKTEPADSKIIHPEKKSL